MQRFTSVAVFVMLVVSGGANGNAQTGAPTSSNGVVLQLAISESALANLPRRTITVVDENGQSAAYSGVDLGVLLAKNGAPSGAAIRGHAVADYVVVRASDGYRAVFALCELDPSITDKIVLVADRRNGSPIGSQLGPFRIVVPDEKHQMRWVRNVTEVAVFTAT
jgi:hypothetical protein